MKAQNHLNGVGDCDHRLRAVHTSIADTYMVGYVYATGM